MAHHASEPSSRRFCFFKKTKPIRLRLNFYSVFVSLSCINSRFLCCSTGGLFPTESHEYEVFRFALSHHQDIPKLVPQVDMVKMGNSFSMTYACKYRISGD